jgi:alanine-glyoxylate transaminase/serine-glyoxylate transaminase/serine-pyruvate transaminase
MEASIANLIEPGDRMVACACGYFGARLADMARRAGAEVVLVEAPWGSPVDPERVRAALSAKRAKAVAVVHAETSTGVLQPLEEIARIARQHEALLIVDTVASLGGVPVEVDALGIDLAYSGSQKCLSAPPGLAPLTASDRAREAIWSRESPSSSWYLDLMLLDRYWSGKERAYHHTAPIPLIYALHEALRLTLEEGLERRWARHLKARQALADGMDQLGLDSFIVPEHRLPTVTAIRVPKDVDDKATRRLLLEEDGIEIAGGLGPLAGKIWRVGLMGHGARVENVSRLVAALKRILGR